MILKFFNDNNQSFFQICILFYIVTIIAFLFNLDPNGGAYLDYINQKRISQKFAQNFINEFFNFDQETTRHSPVLLIILSFFEKLKLADIYIRLINLHFCLLLPFFVYKLIITRFKFLKREDAFLLSCLTFLSPTFISLSIWPDSRLYGLIFFCIALINYFNFNENNKFKYAIRCVFWYAISSYFSPNFALFSIFFMYKFFIFYKFRVNFLYLILFNLIIACPALIYVFSLDSIFFFKSGVAGKEFNLLENLNFSNKILIISTMIFFYLIPFYFSNLFKLNSINLRSLTLSLFIFFICLFFFNYSNSYSGGGIFLKVSNYFFGNNIFFYLVALFSVYIIIELTKLNFDNALIILLLILSNVQFSIYHKYYDPLLFILLFSILDIKLNSFKLKKIKLIYFYMFSATFLILNFVKQII
jgi:hypothetical protein